MQGHTNNAQHLPEHLSGRFRSTRREESPASNLPEQVGHVHEKQVERTGPLGAGMPSNAGDLSSEFALEDSWLNDTHNASRHSPSISRRHRSSYEDLPTMMLSATKRPVNADEQKHTLSDKHQDILDDDDETQHLSAKRKIATKTSQIIHTTTYETNKTKLANRTISGANSTNTHQSTQKDSHTSIHNENDYGPIKALLENTQISSITALSPQRIYVELRERCGMNGRTRQVRETPYRFEDEPHMMRVIENLLRSAGRSLPTSWSLSDVRLPDGSLLSVSLPPGTPQGPTFTIRKPSTSLYTLADLVREGMLDTMMAQKLRRYISMRYNICVCGPAGSAKVLLLNAMCAEIAESERIVTIEEMNEQRTLQLRQPQVIALLTQQEHAIEGVSRERGNNSMTMRNVLSHALRMSPQRIVVGYCHSSDAPTLIRAMYDGCDGMMTTMFATDVRDCLSRLEVLCLVEYLKRSSTTQATPTLHALIRAQIAASLHVVVSMSPEGKVKELVAMPYNREV